MRLRGEKGDGRRRTIQSLDKCANVAARYESLNPVTHIAIAEGEQRATSNNKLVLNMSSVFFSMKYWS